METAVTYDGMNLGTIASLTGVDQYVPDEQFIGRMLPKASSGNKERSKPDRADHILYVDELSFS